MLSEKSIQQINELRSHEMNVCKALDCLELVNTYLEAKGFGNVMADKMNQILVNAMVDISACIKDELELERCRISGTFIMPPIHDEAFPHSDEDFNEIRQNFESEHAMKYDY